MTKPIEQAKQTPTVDCYGLKKLENDEIFVLTKGEKMLSFSPDLDSVMLLLMHDFYNKRYNRLAECGEREIKISISIR